MAVGFNDTQNRYDRLIKLIIQELDRLLDDLSQDKKKIKERRNTIAHEVHAQKMEFVADKKAEMVTKVEVAKFNNGSPYRIPTSSLQPLFALEVQLEQLIVQEIDIERREIITIKDDPARIDNEITIIKEIIAYLKDNAGSKGKRRGLTREAGNALHDKIKDVYDSVWTREEEAKLTATHFEPLKVEIENKVGQIIAQINAIIEKIPDAAQQREEEEKEEVPAKDALHVIEREAKYWMAAYDILKDLVAVARSNENLTKKIEEAKKLLKQLKTRERREQWRAPVSKIKKGLKSIELPEAEINRLLQQLKIFEGKTLIDTVNLEELLKNEEDVDWNEVKGEAETIMRDLQAALKIIEDLKAKLAVQQARAVEKSIARNRAERAERKGKANGNIRKKFASARQKVVGGVTGVGGTLPNWVKRNPNPVPALQNWWANVASTAKRLREKVKKGGADVSEELAEAEAEDETVPEAIKKFKSLLRIIDNVKNFNPKESAKLVELGNRLSGYQSGISEGLKRIKIPGRIKRLVGKDADGVVNAAEGAEETALEIERELSKWGNLKGWLSSRTQNINLRGKLASARQKVAEEVKRKIRRK